MPQENALPILRSESPLAGPNIPASHEQVALVTGAAGFIGSHLAEQLLHLNYTVVGLDSFNDYYARELKEKNVAALRAHPRFHLIAADLRETNLRELLTGHRVSVIFHQAGQAGVRPSWGAEFQPYVERNILATQMLLEACARLPDPTQIRKFVFASSSSVYGDAETLPTPETALPRPISPYGVTKLAAEHLCFLYGKQYGLPGVALRYFSGYGPRQRPDMAMNIFVRALVTHQPIKVLGDGEQTREMTYVADIVAANLLALNAPNGSPHVYNVGGGSRSTINGILEMLGEIAGTQPQLVYESRAAGDHRHGAADISLARRELGYEPSVSLEQGLRQQFAWQKQIMAR